MTGIYRKVPPRPIPKCWTRVHATCKYFDLAHAVHGIHAKAIQCAYDNKYKKHLSDLLLHRDAERPQLTVDAGPQDESDLLSYVPNADWQEQNELKQDDFKQKTGIRRHKTLEFEKSPYTPQYVSAASLTLFPLDYVIAWLLRMNKVRHSDPCSKAIPCPLLDLLYSPMSPVRVALQYYAHILSSTSHRLPALRRFLRIGGNE
eukprot:1942439-Karenia_brevis.AAC.1